jgi:hypothetical protein
MCLKMVETAWTACEDKDSLKYAILCHTAGSAYYELNRLTECRKYWTKMMEIRDSLLSEDDLEVSDLSNLRFNISTSLPPHQKYLGRAAFTDMC